MKSDVESEQEVPNLITVQEVDEDIKDKESDKVASKPKEEVKIEESKISKSLSEKNTKVVIILILTMLFLLPLFNNDTYINEPTFDDLLIILDKMNTHFGENSTSVLNFVDEMFDF